MEIPEQILQKAYSGGYKHGLDNPVLDPSFFQALGNVCVSDAYKNAQEEWVKHTYKTFFEINLTEGWESAVKYLSDLIEK